MLQTSRARMLLGRPRNAACCAALSLAVAAGMAAAAAGQPDCAAHRCATAAHLAAPVPTTPRVANPPPAVPVYRPADAGGLPTGPAPRP